MATHADSSPVVTVSSAITADTDGDWVELFPSTSKEYKWMIVSIFRVAFGVLGQFDIGTGEPGSQVDDVIQDQFTKWIQNGGSPINNVLYSFPMQIPLGTRLWIRIKDDVAAIRDYEAVVTLSTIPLSTIIPNSSESFAVQGGVSSPASFDVYGSWVTMFPSLAEDRSWLCLAIYSASGGTFTARLDLGSGDPETVDWGELHFKKRTTSTYHGSAIVYNVPVDWSAGTKLSVRVKDSHSSSKFYSVGAVLF